MVVPPGIAAGLILSTLLWTDADSRPLNDPSGLWGISVGAFLALGIFLAGRANRVRSRPAEAWRQIPSLDRGFLLYCAGLVGISGRTVVRAGEALSVFSAVSVVVYVLGAAIGWW